MTVEFNPGDEITFKIQMRSPDGYMPGSNFRPETNQNIVLAIAITQRNGVSLAVPADQWIMFDGSQLPKDMYAVPNPTEIKYPPDTGIVGWDGSCLATAQLKDGFALGRASVGTGRQGLPTFDQMPWLEASTIKVTAEPARPKAGLGHDIVTRPMRRRL